MTNFVTTEAACSKIMVYTATAPTAANKAAAGVDIITFGTFGQTLTWNLIASTKTAVVGTHTFTIKAADWWGNANAKTGSIKVLISDSLCEAKATLTLTNVGAAAVTYKLGDAAVEYPYSVTALKPSYCKYTIASKTIPTTNSFNTHLTNDATNKKFKMAKTLGPGTLASTTAYTVIAQASTLHGTAIDVTAKLWSKKITITDPCASKTLTYTVTAPTGTPLTYEIGAKDHTVMDAYTQITQGGGTSTGFCILLASKRITAHYTFGSDSTLFKTDHDTTGKLIFLQSYTVADKKSITVTVQYKLDTVVLTGKKFSFTVVTKTVCKTPTFTLPAAQSTTPSLYIGRTTTIAWPAWTLSPTFCKFVYIVDATSSGPLGTAHSKFTINTASDKHTIAIATSSTTFTTLETKTYTLAITAKYPTSSGTLVAGKSYSYKFTVAKDPCIAGTPTQVAATKNEQRKWSCTVLGTKDCE